MIRPYLQSAITLLLITFAALQAGADNEQPGKSVASVEKSRTETIPTPPSIKHWFAAAQLTDISLSPDGQLVAFLTPEGLRVGNPETGFTTLDRYGAKKGWSDLHWAGPRTLVISQPVRRGGLFSFLKLVPEGNGFRIGENSQMTEAGYLVDPLPEQEDQVLFARFTNASGELQSNVFRLNIFETLDGQFRSERRLNFMSSEITVWYTDRKGRLRLGVSYEEGTPVLWENKDGRRAWQRLWTGQPDQQFIPIHVSEDDDTLWALTTIGSDTLKAVEFDLLSAKIVRDVFQHPRFDITNLLFVDGHRGPVAAEYLREGLAHLEPLSAAGESLFDMAASSFPGQLFKLVDYHADSGTSLMHVHQIGTPGSIHFCDESGACQFISSVKPELDDIRLARPVLLEVNREDAAPIEAFLTLPTQATASVPLLVMPHGGPIGVQDSRYYDPSVQWFAQEGFAVLQVNYRGSAGYGGTFQAQGMQQFGRAIEDDIEASVDAALAANQLLDPDRIAVYGGSYGGYSALMGVIRNPERYRCAVSYAGVTDLNLIFTQASTRMDDALRKAFKKIIGDPEQQRAELKTYSPVYRYRDVQRPVLLIHGTEDRIVDVEHSWRMYKMLELAEADVAIHILDDLGHSPETTSQVAAAMEPVIPFLERCLGRSVGQSDVPDISAR